MKIKNELISLKVGKKQYDFNNLILDEYLKRFAKAQLDKDGANKISIDKLLTCCLIKFDIPIENIKSDMDIHNQDFDICFVGCNHVQTISEEQISIQYDYGTSGDILIYDYSKNTGNETYLRDYLNRKITAIGFNTSWINDTNSTNKVPVCAILDTSNYNIYLQENQELSITRKDIITTDAIFYSSDKNKIPGPVHLAPLGVPQIIEQPNIYNEDQTGWASFEDSGYGILYSIGLSSYKDYIDKELIIGQDIQIENNESELQIKGIENYIELNSSLFCNKNIHPSTNIFPIKSNYKYVILKYKVWQIVHTGTYDNIIETPTDTGYFYYQAIPIDKFGKTNVKIRYERG